MVLLYNNSRSLRGIFFLVIVIFYPDALEIVQLRQNCHLGFYESFRKLLVLERAGKRYEKSINFSCAVRYFLQIEWVLIFEYWISDHAKLGNVGPFEPHLGTVKLQQNH